MALVLRRFLLTRRPANDAIQRWPDFGLTTTPNADNCCALLSTKMAGHTPGLLVTSSPADIYGSVRLDVALPVFPGVPSTRDRGLARETGREQDLGGRVGPL